MGNFSKLIIYLMFPAVVLTGVSGEVGHTGEEEMRYRRIVSLSPSVTETMFKLGLGERVVGVTRFCKYPPGVEDIVEVGGYLDPNYEAIASLRPDMVFVLPEQEKVGSYLDRMDISYVTVDNKKIEDILSTVKIIGETCGAGERGRKLVKRLKQEMEEVRNRTRGLPSPRVLISVGRSGGEGELNGIYAAGKGTYYDQLLEYAGGINACRTSRVSYPVITLEGILDLKPDIIIDIVYSMKKDGLDSSDFLKDWQSLISFGVIQDDDIYILDQDYWVIPGPRFVKLLYHLAGILHPRVKLEIDR